MKGGNDMETKGALTPPHNEELFDELSIVLKEIIDITQRPCISSEELWSAYIRGDGLIKQLKKEEE